MEATGPGAPVLEGDPAEISCEIVDGYPDRLDDVVWFKNDAALDIGKYNGATIFACVDMCKSCYIFCIYIFSFLTLMRLLC